MKTKDSGRKTANARGSRSAPADNGGGANQAGNARPPRRTAGASTAYTTNYVDAAPQLRRTANPAIHLHQRTLLTPAGRRQREHTMLALIDVLLVARWVAKREAQRRALAAAHRQAAPLALAPSRAALEHDDDASGPQYRDPYGDRDLTD
ncbi:hypothetical protein PPMP20_21960 [Paraburkholderia phymatum]|uniref:Uncharacterized protein n=1 Tax=Paraburkholderia phymatum (strain DSM 17167 / CIP 108236 / LMG 21445 / STM815) TaxID=391038 RepID=B2JN04_PARP8|nr:hypothetical protein [Paraburkholderia phymatum]ACC74397.1 hypothetical protein Bphy_5319 [Paraburkholderia phymatum STM815]